MRGFGLNNLLSGVKGGNPKRRFSDMKRVPHLLYALSGSHEFIKNQTARAESYTRAIII